jgi:hypothetical protein
MLIALILMAISVVFYFIFIPSQVPVTGTGTNVFTSRTFPRFLMVSLFVVAVVMFLEALYRDIKLRQQTPRNQEKSAKDLVALYVMPLVAFALILAYALLFKYVGVIPATAVFIPAFLALFRCKKWSYYAGAYGFCAVLYLVFVYILHVPLR